MTYLYEAVNTRLLVFDFDGVLIEALPGSYPMALFRGIQADRIWAGDKFLTFKSTDWIGHLSGLGVDTSDRQALAEISWRMYEFNKEKIRLYDWVGRTIPQLARSRRLAILSNNSMVIVRRALGGLEKYFSAIKTWENVEKLKPDPAGLLDICRELDTPPAETCLVGDSDDDFFAAREAGTKLLMLNGCEIIPSCNAGLVRYEIL